MLELNHIKKIYRMGTNEVRALDDISLKIDRGDFVAIMGPSGSGKSTLMHILGLLDVPTEGSYKINDQEVSKLSEDELALQRSKLIGFIFQQFNLLPRMSAEENVALPLFYSKLEATTHHSLNKLESVGLGDRAIHKINELSGGQQQRVAIARSLVNEPTILFADEPTGNLDSKSENEILSILHDLNAKGITIVIVTHEEHIGAQAKRLIKMRDGKIQSDERLKSIGHNGISTPKVKEYFTQSVFKEIISYFKQGFITLAANKIRSGLSMLGILIGVAAVVAMLAVGRGAQKSIEAQLSSLGSNLLIVHAGAVRIGGVSQESGVTTRLGLEDVQLLRDQLSSARYVNATVNGRGQVTYLNKNWNTQVLGTMTPYTYMRAATPTIGKFFSDDDNLKRNRVAVIGATVVKELFGSANPIGEMIKINKVSFQVIGILPVKGSNGFRDQDDNIVIPLLTGMHRLLGKDYVDSLEIEIKDTKMMESAQEDLLHLLNYRHKVPPSQEENAFNIHNMADIQDAVSQSSKTMSMLLSVIAAISLLVGGIGIMNIMLVSVTERTREIGLRKALGAKRRDILLQFLTESVVVSVSGGFMGIVSGWAIATALSIVSGWNVSISLSSVMLAFFFSATTGIIFGIYPARKASFLHPIDALRHD
jgi:macrolide transport system ATP-binding/permease protein